jgi:hypothetical protein|tara:strand:- start:355 stop:558 length:204 start_codon:yes stop_codon:yes gene_type:complete
MAGSFDILKNQIRLLNKEIEIYKNNFETQIERADNWMALYMQEEKENQELLKVIRKLVKAQKNEQKK